MNLSLSNRTWTLVGATGVLLCAATAQASAIELPIDSQGTTTRGEPLPTSSAQEIGANGSPIPILDLPIVVIYPSADDGGSAARFEYTDVVFD